MKKTLAILLAAALLLSMASAAFAEMTLKVGENGARLRSAPYVDDNNTIAKIHQYEYLTGLRQQGQWYYVNFNGLYGYVHSGNVTVVSQGNSGGSTFFDNYSGGSDNPFDNYNGGSANPFDNYNGGSANPFDNYYGGDVYGGDIKENYAQYGGTAVECFAYAGQYGCKLRTAMDINDSSNAVHNVHKGEPLYVYCYFYKEGYKWYYVITQDGYEGYAHSGNVFLQ